jgi:hypothetical protein
MVILLELVAGVGITDREGEEAEPEGQQDQIKHRKLLAALVHWRAFSRGCAP